MITKDNLVRHELVGLDVQLVDGSNPQIIGINGTIINETRYMFTLKTKKGIKNVPKNFNSWKFKIDEDVTVDGKLLTKRPFERLVIKQ
ncbi:MAG: ribonuclease P protein subunit [Nitrosopumilaceae archaeon]|nr:ribonuclease P protein subunit [Nitrosopumilaceae archaeon]NIU02528.1 ribonuclease P protein subunit [Nitrosopumilaceae archaeon]NIU88989.1 ribonuclease P protein subunit [Nitrosopumilaceae archaeon]NIV67100.1 ribonuclease P protein subunit [Nitrosopumilaceae archaeon]NIX63129.1 ribonuclease P protein subunit [Nitrosopumilaceae archaeon]